MGVPDTSTAASESQRLTREFWVGLARAFGGAIFFSIPLLLTEEMWQLGFYMDRFRLALLLILNIPVLVGLSYFSGFKPTVTWMDDVVDAVVAYGVAILSSFVVLSLISVIDFSMPLREITGKLALQAVPASIGATLASSQLGGRDVSEEEERKEKTHYKGEIFFMAVGSTYLAITVAPTLEMVEIALRMSEWHTLAVLAASLAMMHAFVYAVDFRGQERVPEGTPWWSLFLRFTIVGYALAVAISMYMLWTFGRLEAVDLPTMVRLAIVLGFPASLGSAVARLIL